MKKDRKFALKAALAVTPNSVSTESLLREAEKILRWLDGETSFVVTAGGAGGGGAGSGGSFYVSSGHTS